MKTNQIIYYAIFLLAGGIGGYWLGSRSAKTITETPAAIAVSNPEKAPVEPAALPAETPAVPETAAEPAEAKPAETPETAAAPANAPAPPAAKPASTPAVTATTPANPSASPASSASAGSLPTASKCFSGDKELEDDLNLYASEIEAKKLIYSRELMQDCSGIFYRLLDEFAKKKCDGYQYPDPKSARPARMIAKWFFDNKNFKLVKDPMVSRNMIKPGAVMFYGAPGKKYHDTGIEQLSQQGGIFHVGVVTSVTRDADGNVTQYTLFHGRSTGTTAGRTFYHNIRGPSNLGQPVLGVGSQEWVGISYLYTPKT